jgi:hypothetical protein
MRRDHESSAEPHEGEFEVRSCWQCTWLCCEVNFRARLTVSQVRRCIMQHNIGLEHAKIGACRRGLSHCCPEAKYRVRVAYRVARGMIHELEEHRLVLVWQGAEFRKRWSGNAKILRRD